MIGFLHLTGLLSIVVGAGVAFMGADVGLAGPGIMAALIGVLILAAAEMVQQLRRIAAAIESPQNRAALSVDADLLADPAPAATSPDPEDAAKAMWADADATARRIGGKAAEGRREPTL